jgi:hypothetical protein
MTHMQSTTWTKWTLAALLVASAGAARADFRLEKQFDLTPGGTFSLRSEAGSVTVRGGAGQTARIVVTSTRDDFADLFDTRFEPGGANRLDVTIERKSHFGHWSFGGRTEVDVELPRDVEAEIHSSGGSVEISALDGRVKAGSSGGSVHISDIGGAVELSSSGGGVEVRDVKGGARVDSSGGSVTLDRIAGDVDASSSGGGVRITDAGGRVVADSSGGPVRVVFAAGNAKGGDLQSSGGGVHVGIDPAVGLDVDASSSGGGVSCDLPLTIRGRVSRNHLVGRLNGGGATLRLRSSGGGVTLEER